MVRETRHLWVGNLPENIREERIREHFKRYGRVQSVKLLPRGSKEGVVPGGGAGGGAGGAAPEGTLACTIAFMDIKSAAKAHTAEHKLDERTLTTEYYEPAAIPSAAAPQTPERASAVAVVAAGPYTAAANNSRFPNSHGSSEEHTGFSERFYERGGGRVADPEYLRRPGYHDTSRGRARDRLYRNGPPYPPAILDRSHRSALGSSWPYEGTSARYSAGQAPDAAYVSAAPAPEPAERRASADVQVAKKKTKSRSGSRTPSPSGSTSSRSPSRSRSRSSSSSSSSSTSRGSSSPTSSPRARGARVQSAVSAAPPVHSEDRRPLAIIVRNLPARSSDTSLKDGLFHEYKKHGKVTWVKVVGQSSDRYALVCFKKPDDVEKALEVSYDKSFFGCKIEVGPYQGYDVEDNEFRPYEAELDEYHPKATRTLFIGNLEKDVTASDLRKHFDQFGEIIEIDIKKQGAVSSYAFCQYSDIVSVVKAIRKMDGEHLGNNRIKLGFGKSMPTPCVWVDGVSERVDEKYLTLQFERYGQVTQVSIDRDRGHALIFFEQLSCAQTAVKEMRGVTLRGKKLQVDFASRECQDTFFDHLEKQGAGSERPPFDTARDPVQRERSFESSTLATTTRYTRYDTPSRPRTSSYSSRSGTGSQCTGSSAVPSPGTPGSVTPRGSGSRSRLTRFNEYYEAGVEYPERRFRSYDEFSQGSGASHEDVYEHEYIYNRESPGHIEPVESRTMQSVVVTTEIQPTGTTFVPPDIRHLQKERVHLLEQLDECPSSGDELMSPKKRLKLDICDVGTVVTDVLDVNHGDHRKVIEVRRLSDTPKHHSRRPSIDGKHCIREVPVERAYMPHAVCKRRKTSGSESDRSRIHHHHDMSGSESLAGSRPGTPLCDERPENLPPSEPRRLPRERNANEGPLSLPLPRFAAQVLNSPRLNISVAGFKGSKENIVSSPPAAVTSPKVANPIPPSPVHVPPPASPPPRPPSSSNSSDSDAAPPSPTLEERLRSLDEKYEKWSGSRALSAAGGDALAKLDASASERFRFRHKLLDLDLKELQPSEIVKSVLAKRSVFDEDTKRLENVGEKYEPRDFTAFPRTFVSLQSNVGSAAGGMNTPPAVPASPLLSPAAASSAKSLSGTALSPRSLAANIPAAKGLQYPFPSHPPVVSPVAGGTASAPSPARVTGNVHSDNTRLKLCPSLPSDRTNSKVNLNRSGCAAAPPSSVVSGAAVASTVSKHKSLDKNGDSDKINSNIPINSCENASVNVSSSATTVACSTANNSSDAVTNHVGKTPPRDKSTSRKEDRSSDKVSKGDKVIGRRDSVSSSPSSANNTKCDRKDRREKKSDKDNDSNGDYRTGKAKDNDTECDRKREKESEYCDRKLEEEKQKAERAEKERQEVERKEKEEREKLERERQELERQEKERLEKEKEKLEKERQEKERQEREKQERLEKERLERERKKEKEERERREREERERREREERERREREERERREREERERREKEEQMERERIEKEKQRERERREREEKERREREELEKERQEKELHERQMKEKQEHRKREKENEKHERRHKEDNHESKEKKKDKEDYDKPKQRENHSENSIDIKNRHRENHIDVAKVNDRHRDSHDSRKENKDHEFRIKDSHDNMRNNHEMQRKDSHDKSKDHHDSSRSNSERRDEKHSHCNDVRKDESSKNRHHLDREDSKDRRKDSIKEIRDSNNHEKNRHFSTDSRDNNKDRHSSTDSRHTSTDSEKNRQYSDHGLNSTPNRIDASKRKDKINSAPASVGCKRRISSQDSSESPDDSKRLKVSVEHRKISDRRDSKDSRDSNTSRSSDKVKQNKHNNKSNFTRMLEDKIREEKRNKELSDEKRREKEREREREDRYKLKQQQKIEKQKIKSKNRESRDSKDSPGTPKSASKELILDKDFLARLDLRANEDEEKQKLLRKDNKEKRKQENHDLEERRSSDDTKRPDDRKKDKIVCPEKKNRDENNMLKNSEDKNKNPQRKDPQRIRKQTNSSDTSDSDEPKKHSIFDIVDDEPAYISMYDKVKARSCKNMQKQEEEKRQEKLKAKFTQLKQSRAKREEKKRSTSWDEDSDSDHMDSGNQDQDQEHISNKQNRRGNKMLITSSSEDELNSIPKSRKKPEMYTDSDSDRIRIEKHDRLIDSSDDETARNKSVSRKGSKSRITSDTSEDDQPRKRVDKIKKERYSDSEVDQGFADSDERTDMKHYKKPKEEKLNHYDDEKYIKKEKKSSTKISSMSDDDTTRKMLTDAVKAEIFGEKDDVKIENNKCIERLAMLCDISSEGETGHNMDSKKDLFGEDKSEIRKKHKKKQKRQKNSLLTEDTIKLERMLDEVENDSGNRGDDLEKKMSEKKKHGSKKDKKRDKVKDEDRIKDKSKKLKKLNKELCSKGDLHIMKRDGKFEDIFGSLSDDSEPGNKDSLINSIVNKENAFFVQLSDKLQSSHNMYASDSDSVQQVDPEKEKLKEESRKRKEKKRREKERRLREENENSVDFADLGKVLEDNLKDEPMSDEVEKPAKPIKIEIEEEQKVEENHNSNDIFRFSDGDESPEIEKKELVEKKEMNKEKKKKRKKSKEEKQNRHHHHHEKNQEKVEKIKSPDLIKKEPPTLIIEDIKEESDIKPSQQSPSLPNLLDIPSPPQTKSTNNDFQISPLPREPLISPIPKTPTSSKAEKKREKFIPGFGSEIDEKIHENAVKSISDFGSPTLTERIEQEEIKTVDPPKVEKSEVIEDKPRVVISQEETEDAVAALLGESFGGGDFDCYNESQNSPTTTETNAETTNDEVTLAEDDEEMRQAVQSLNAADMEAKPDTPQSENDLQIDTDTDDCEEIVVPYEQSPRTPDMVDLSRPPKTPDFPTGYYRPQEDPSKIQTPVLLKTPAENTISQIKSPVTKDAKPISEAINEVKRNIEVQIDKPVIKPPVPRKIEKSPPVSSEPSRTVISQSWTIPPQQKLPEKIVVTEPVKKEEPPVEKRKPEPQPIITKHTEEQKAVPHLPITPQKSLPTLPTSLSLPPLQASTQSVVTTPTTTVLTSQTKSYLAPPVIKISDHTSHSNIISPKLEQSLSPIKTYNNLNIMSTISTTMPPALTTVMSKQRTMPQIPASKPVRIQHAHPVISHLTVASSKQQNPPVMTQSGGLLTTVVTSTHIQPNRLPIQSIMASKPMQPTTMILPQSKIAVSTIQKIVSSPEVSKPQEPPRMVYHSSGNMTVPSYSYPHTLTHPQPIPTSVPVPLRTAPPPVGLLAPARHILPPTSYGFPPTTRSISPLVKEPTKSVIEKTMPVISELQKPPPVSMPAHIYSQPPFSQPPTSLHLVNTDMKPSTPVIQEVQTPKLVPLLTTPSEVRISQHQHSIIQQAPPQKSMPSVQEIIRHSPVSQSVVSQAPQPQPPMIVVSKPVSTASHSTVCHPVISHVVMSQPVILQPTVSQHSIVSQPVTSHTVKPQSVVSQPHIVVSQPHIIVSQPMIPKPIISQPIISHSVATTPIISHTSTPKPVISHPATTTLTVNTDVTVKPPVEIRIPTSAPQDIINEIPKVIKETLSRSTPSPVIVSTPKEHLSPAPPPMQEQLQIKKEEPSEKDVPPVKTNTHIPENNVHVKKEIKTEDSKPIVVEDKIKIEPQQPKVEVPKSEEKPLEIKQQPETTEDISVIKEVDHYDKEKQEDTESVISEPKESLTSELCMKDDPLDSKEDSDYWSAKEVNIESVIKKVDALCSADELSEGSEAGKDEWYENENKLPEPEIKHDESLEKEPEKSEDCDTPDVTKADTESENLDESLDNNSEEKELSVRNSRRGGRTRGRKNNKTDRLGVTTRRGKSATTTTSRRGGRGGRTRNDKKTKTSESDIYEFHDDSDESKDRPRLILTIKSPAGAGNTPSTPSAVIKETAQKPPEPPREEFVSPAANTRKSRRIQERDGSRNTVDDVIEDVVRNAAVVTRSAAAAAQGLPSPRRSTRQNVMKVPPVVEPRKSPRATRRKDRRVSENTDDSSEEKSVKKEDPKPEPEPVKEEPVVKEVIKVPPKQQEKEKAKSENIQPMGLKANLIRRLKSEEPMTLIDPVTGLLTQMRECEEGKYIPVSTSASSVITGTVTVQSVEPKHVEVPETCRLPTSTVTSSHPPVEQISTTVIAKSQPVNPVLQKPQSLKAHVLSSQAAKVVVNQTAQIPKTATVQTVPLPQPQQQQPNFIPKPNIPVSQHLNVNVSVAPAMDPTNLSPRQSAPKPVHVLPQAMKNVTPAPMSPSQMGTINNPKQHFLQAAKQLPPKPSTPINPKTHLLNAVQNQNIVTGSPSVVNATLTHMKTTHMPQAASLPSPVKQQVVANVAPIVKPHNLHVPQQILTGAVASPPLKHHIAQQPIVTGASSGRMGIPSSSPMPGISAKGALDPQKVEVSIAGCVMISHPTVSPQAQARGQVLQAGMPVPAYEASLHGVGDHPLFSRQSPPPAHQQTSPAPQGEPMSHFAPGAMPLRTPHDLPPHHFMHSHPVYQQYLRAQQEARIPYHLPRSPMVGGLEKTKDGQEGEEAPVTSPPLELRRPGSVGLTPRPTAVPHSLQSPHDRATDSPQVAQVYMQARIPHYHTPGPGRYYETPAEPPPAHRPVTSHTGLTGPGSSLGAAGNLTGALARHSGAEAPASQRGLQVATPPHASQVPPQADSLLMLLKQYRIMWQGLLALKNDQAAVQMHFVFGNPHVARNSLPCNSDGSTPPLRIAQRMRLEKTQVEGVARKMQMENEHCVLLALPCGRDHMDVLQQSTNLSNGFITYLQQKEAAGIVNIAAPGSQHAAYVVHIFPSCDFVKENLARIAPNLLHRVADIAHLLIVIATV